MRFRTNCNWMPSGHLEEETPSLPLLKSNVLWSLWRPQSFGHIAPQMCPLPGYPVIMVISSCSQCSLSPPDAPPHSHFEISSTSKEEVFGADLPSPHRSLPLVSQITNSLSGYMQVSSWKSWSHSEGRFTVRQGKDKVLLTFFLRFFSLVLKWMV